MPPKSNRPTVVVKVDAGEGSSSVVGCNADERKAWAHRGAQILFSSTFDAVLPSSLKPSLVYAGVAEAAAAHAAGGGLGCVICMGLQASSKGSTLGQLPAAGGGGARESEELGVVARAVVRLLAAGHTLSLSAVQLYFEMPTDLLDGDGEAVGDGPCGARRLAVADGGAALALLARARRSARPRARSRRAPTSCTRSASTAAASSSSSRWRRPTASPPSTRRAPTRRSTHCSDGSRSRRPKPADAELLLLPRCLRAALDGVGDARTTLVVCAGGGSAEEEAAALRLAQQTKEARWRKAAATDEKGEGKKIEALQAKIDALNGAAPKPPDELERALADQVGEAADIERAVDAARNESAALEASLAEARRALDAAEQEAYAGGGGGAAAEQAAAEERAAAEQALALELAGLREQLAQATADQAQTAAAAEERRRSGGDGGGGFGGDGDGGGRKAQMEEQVARYERAVHSAWEDVQRAQQQAQQVEEHFERSRAHARQSAAEREEMETTLLDVAADLENLARNYRLHGSPAMAVPLYVSALAIFEKTLGAEHPQVASNLVNLGNAFCDQGKHAEAAPVYLRALAIDEKALGHDHPEVAMDLSNLGIAYRALGRADVAQSLFERAHKIMVSALGEGDPKTKAIYRNLMASAVAPGGDGAPAEPPPVVIEA